MEPGGQFLCSVRDRLDLLLHFEIRNFHMWMFVGGTVGEQGLEHVCTHPPACNLTTVGI